MLHVPTEKELNARVKLVEVTVRGDYIARIDEKRKTTRPYTIKVKVPEGFSRSDVKRLTPPALRDSEKHPDFIIMRTHTCDGKATPTKETIKRRDLYTAHDLARFERVRVQALKEGRNEQALRNHQRAAGGISDTSDYDPRTGLPPLVEPELENIDEE
jgi:hypothetical protein